jgi:hypothetical protein
VYYWKQKYYTSLYTQKPKDRDFKFWNRYRRKEPLGRPRRRWVDNIKMDLREIGWDSMDWIDLAQDRDQWRALVNAVMNLRVS